MKSLVLVLPCLFFAVPACKRGSGHAKPEEDVELLQIEPTKKEQQANTPSLIEPLIPSPLDPKPIETSAPSASFEDNTPTPVKPDNTLPELAIEVLPPETEPAPAEPEFSYLCQLPESTITPSDYKDGSKRFSDVKKRAIEPLKKALIKKNLHLGDPVFIRVFKEEKQVELFIKNRTTNKFTLAHTYKIAGMSGKLGPKKQQGDLQAPEGFYYVPKRYFNPQSHFHLSFNIGYPNTFDQAHNRTGDFIMMHGSDASAGCYAMTNPAIEEIYTICDAALDSGSQRFFRFHSFPFRMTKANMLRHQDSEHYAFWKNLKQGYDYFETNGVPPDVSTSNKNYTFSSP